MRIFENLFTGIAFIFFSLALFSCSDDEESVGSTDDLIGAWSVVQKEGYEKYDGETYPLNETIPEGKETYVFNADQTLGGNIDTGTWSYKGNKLTLDYTKNEDEEDVEVWTVLELTSIRLVKEYREKDGGDEFYMKVTCKKK